MSDPTILYTSWRGLLSAAVSPLLLLGLGIFGVVAGGFNPVGVTLLVIGALLGAITLFDYPRRVEFTATGVTRVCLLRHHHLPWSEVRALVRARGSFLSYLRLRNAGDAPTAPRTPSGGLVARGANSRRWLLCDRIESQPEFDRMRAVVAANASHVAIGAARPAPTTPPTTVFRRGVADPLRPPDERR